MASSCSEVVRDANILLMRHLVMRMELGLVNDAQEYLRAVCVAGLRVSDMDEFIKVADRRTLTMWLQQESNHAQPRTTVIDLLGRALA